MEMGDNVENELQKRQSGGNSNGFWKGFLVALGLMLITILISITVKQVFRIFSLQDIASKESVEQTTDKEESKDKIASLETLQKIGVLQNAIEEFYMGETDYSKLEEGAYRGVVAALGDEYSTYYSEEERIAIEQQSQGIYYGIGAYIGKDAKTQLPVLTGIIENTPAEAAGLLEGDIIVKVGDIQTDGLDTTEVVSYIKGEEGTKVFITIYREGQPDYLEFEVERRKIESPTVEYEMLEDDIGYIQIREFDEVTIDQFKEAYVVLTGNNMKGLVIDVRSNPGGNLSAVVEICRMILPKGMIVYTEDKNGERVEYTGDGKNEIQVPLAVLINGYSASASEILAGAIKDYGIGTLVGTTTYGKGVVQRILSLSDGSAVKLTVSKYFTPKGNNIHEIGIEPDVEVLWDQKLYEEKEIDNQLEKAIEILKTEK